MNVSILNVWKWSESGKVWSPISQQVLEVKEGHNKAVTIHCSAFLISKTSYREYNGKALQRLRSGVCTITDEAKNRVRECYRLNWVPPKCAC